MRNKRLSLALVLLFLFAVPSFAVFNEKDLGQTLAVLRYELCQEYTTMSHLESRVRTRDRAQHSEMIDIMKRCNELSLMLYSQNQDYTFDMTYALQTVTDEYEKFSRRRRPYDEFVSRLDIEIGRYSRLVESLRRLPPQLKDIEDLPDSLKYHNDSLDIKMSVGRAVANVEGFKPGSAPSAAPQHLDEHERELMRERMRTFVLDEAGQIDRDSCLFYATTLLKMYSSTKDRIIADNEHYETASIRLKESYDYAQDRYRQIQKNIFVQGQDSYLTVLGSFGAYFKRALQDARAKYGTTLDLDGTGAVSKSEWKGPKVLGFIGIVLLWLFAASGLSVLVVKVLKRRVKKMQTEDFCRHIPCLTFLCGSVIFALTLMVLSRFVQHNFFALASGHLLVFAWLLAAILLSLLIRLDGSQIKAGMNLYLPLILMGLIVIVFRIIFIPNRLVNLFLPPLLLGFAIWQFKVCVKNKETMEDNDELIGWITFFIIAATTVIAWIGYVLFGVQILMWWLFQVSAIETIMAISKMLDGYYEKVLRKKLPVGSDKGTHLEVTWFFDLMKKTIVPSLAIISLPLCIMMAANVFDLTDICKAFYHKSVVNLFDSNGNEILKLSFSNLVIVAVLYFIFRYISYLVKAVYHDYRFKVETKRSGGAYIHSNQINFTLANNVISIIVWGIYIITLILILKIPTGAISIVGAGLATGLGLAMKDVLNNFIYGIQLMSGRLRVGDWVECDGIRGKVTAISYQSTQIETLDGALVSYLNTSLFDKNFKNLTRNNAYEFVKIVVGVNYGADIDQVRKVLLNALQPLQTRDRYGRNVVDMSRGVSVVFDEFNDSSIAIAVKQYVLVAERNNYIAKSKESIYNALNANGITIPFPQRDVHIIADSEPGTDSVSE